MQMYVIVWKQHEEFSQDKMTCECGLKTWSCFLMFDCKKKSRNENKKVDAISKLRTTHSS